MFFSGPTFGLGTLAMPDAKTGTPVLSVSENVGARKPVAMLPDRLQLPTRSYTAPVLHVRDVHRLSSVRSLTVKGGNASCGRGSEWSFALSTRAPADHESDGVTGVCTIAKPSVTS